MPMFTYTPQWDEIALFLSRMTPFIPAGYTGLAGIRLHRTGNPLELELFGKSYPDKPLFPMVPLEFKAGQLARSLAELEIKHDVPWIKKSDFDLYRQDVMSFYQAEDLLEPRAEAILKSDAPDEAEARKAVVDHEAVAAQAR